MVERLSRIAKVVLKAYKMTMGTGVVPIAHLKYVVPVFTHRLPSLKTLISIWSVGSGRWVALFLLYFTGVGFVAAALTLPGKRCARSS